MCLLERLSQVPAAAAAAAATTAAAVSNTRATRRMRNMQIGAKMSWQLLVTRILKIRSSLNTYAHRLLLFATHV